ncbi:hypothetical protein PYW07_009927 [Mythimna separata]|uniref:SCP domain-containing protein n=1 Tax=Mythimna separata TaxID=271217 RepID=A0AAD8DR46_MYTSE|nr:hypothetical protein PYW07_009927 [Mythimna separata]
MIITKLTTCTIVHDTFDQESVHITKYCIGQRYCREGTHVVCMYYDHSHKFGPHCANPVKVEVTPKMIQNILANINDIRGEIATGTEKGKDGEVLPRAYGLMKLEWDAELAFLAQILANQCLGGKGDLCRATDRFPNPSQTIAIIRYKYPNWEYLKPNNTEKGLNEEKLIFAVNKFFKSTHALRKSVTNEIIMSCPPSKELPDINLKFYLNLIRGGTTHIGCGISAYSKFKIKGDTESMQNNVQIVCNISDAPRLKQPVYKVVPPIPGTGYSKRCGCPRGYRETRSCLCERDPKFRWKGQQLKKQQEADLQQDTIQTRPHDDEDNEEPMAAVQPNLSGIQDSSENNNKKTNEIESPQTISQSRNIFKGNKSEDTEGKTLEKSFDELSKITSAITPKKKNVNSRLTNKRHKSDINFSNPQKRKPAISENGFDDLVYKVRNNLQKEATTESMEENLVDIIVVNDMLNDKQNGDHECDLPFNFKDNPETINEETFTDNSARQNILSEAIDYHVDNYDDEGIKLERRTIDKMIELQEQNERNNKKDINKDSSRSHNDENVESRERRTSIIGKRRLQFSRKNKNGELHQILLRSPSQIDSLRLLINQPRQSMYSSETETFIFK